MIYKTKEDKLKFLETLEIGKISDYVYVSPKDGSDEIRCIKLVWVTPNVFLHRKTVKDFQYYENRLTLFHKNGVGLAIHYYRFDIPGSLKEDWNTFVPITLGVKEIMKNNYLWADDPIELYKSLDSYEKDVTCKTQILMYLSE